MLTRRFFLFLLLVLTGCATLIVAHHLDQRFGQADQASFDHPRLASGDAPDYWREVRPILDTRCVACHACYDSPCQLNLASYAGLTRGATSEQVYSATRLFAANTTRLGFDAASNAEWRKKGFFPVLNERANIPEANREGGVMYQLLAAKQNYPSTSSPTDKDLDLSLSRNEICVPAEGAEQYVKQHPLRGMPFALPAMSRPEHNTLSRWLEAGAPYTPPAPLPAAAQNDVAAWEGFLNGNSLKEQLAARYIFEHWYIGQFYFASAPGRYVELVRSSTPPGQPLALIASRRPYDDPGVARVYYRLRYTEATQVSKKFMPLLLNPARMERLRQWLLAPGFSVSKLPDYAPQNASNPFVTFRDLPVDGRYRFMLDEAQFLLTGFMKGPVCRGQVALNVINDHFWVMFVAPDSMAAQVSAQLLERSSPNLQLPAAEESSASLLAWRDYAKLEKRHLETRNQLLASLGKPAMLGLPALWDGRDISTPSNSTAARNNNAALTIMRHFDSASVVKGLVGEKPQTTLVLTYPLFERMHYLLLAGFDVYGNAGHQLATRLYMDFLRMEGELNFIALLPIKDRQKVLDYWYRGRKEAQNNYLADASAYLPIESAVPYKSSKHLDELYAMLKKYVAQAPDPALKGQGSMALNPAEAEAIRRLNRIRGLTAARLPEFSLLMLQRPDGSSRLISLVRNSAHSNIAQLFREDARRLPQEDTLMAIPGVVASYPNAFYRVNSNELGEFVDRIAGLQEDTALDALNTRFGVLRTSPDFWAFSDSLHAEWRRFDPDNAAILDYSRLGNH